ncbi:MAG: serine hydrolase, partial [Myxococcales bacterium]|nr:serine hydrolase [Myxococcales bacterium]
MVEVHGICEPGFERVREAFISNFEKGLDVGASVAVTRDGEFVVDLWAGDADEDGTSWEKDTIVNVYSTTKTMAATC